MRLTPTEQTNLSGWLVRNRPEFAPRETVRVVTMPKPTFTAFDLDAQRRHMQELSTMGIGPSLDEQRRARHRAYREAVAFTIIGIAATFGALLVIWAVAAMIRVAIG